MSSNSQIKKRLQSKDQIPGLTVGRGEASERFHALPPRLSAGDLRPSKDLNSKPGGESTVNNKASKNLKGAVPREHHKEPKVDKAPGVMALV